MATENFLEQFRDKNTKKIKNFTALQFAEVWSHYDKDGNGYIEGRELDSFLRAFITSIVDNDIAAKGISDEALVAMRKDFMAAFDDNLDNKIEMAELARILPTEEKFLLLFRNDNPLDSSVEFMKIWKKFDKDCSGYIEADELKDFIHAILNSQQRNVSEDKIIDYTTTMLQLFDLNKDGKLQLSEMSRLLPVKENYLCRPMFKNSNNITSSDIESVFKLYDRDNNGTIENEELHGFLKDLLELAQEDYDEKDMTFFKNVILKEWDVNHDGKINHAELKMVLLQQSKLQGNATKG